VTGPKHVIEGPNGLAQALDRSIQVGFQPTICSLEDIQVKDLMKARSQLNG
jgi:hypothetical protein